MSDPQLPSKYTAFRCPQDLLAKAKLAAKGQRRSLSNYIITIIDEAVVGIELPEPPAPPVVPPKATSKRK